MVKIESYRLIAYDVETGKVVLDWPDYSIHYPEAHHILENGSDKWEVVGVRQTTTPLVRHIEVRKLE